jgi:hypothetical protein
VSRRRDRVRPVEEDEDEDVDATERPVRTRKAASAKKKTTRRPPPPPVEDEDDDLDDEDEDELEDDELDDEEDDYIDDEEEEESPPPRRKKTTTTRKSTTTRKARRAAPVEDEDEEEEPPRRRKASTKRTGTKSKTKLPPGVRTGWKGAEETRKAAGGGADRVALGNEPILLKFLEDAPLVSFRQHWVPQGANQPDRPYTCVGTDCPICELGDKTSACIVYNVLVLSEEDEPSNKILQVGVRASKALEDAAKDQKGNIRIDKDFFAASRSGKGQQAQTNFRPVKQRDLEDDWPEVLEDFDLDELAGVIEEARENCFDPSIVQTSTRKQLDEVAQYLADD